MVITVIIALIALSSVIELITDIIKDFKNKNPRGYRYANLPAGVNMLELWAIFFLSMALQLPSKPMLALTIVQVVIGFHSLARSVQSRRPAWFDWI